MSLDLFGHRPVVDDGARSNFDWYPTPGWATRSLVYHVPEIAGASVLECASGDDAIAAVLRDEFRCHVVTNDLDEGHQQAQLHFDAIDPLLWLCVYSGDLGPDWVITNPPFNIAFPMLQLAVQHATVGVAFLLRKTFLEPTEERGEWFSKHPPSRIIGLPRHNFRGDGVDSVSCDWMLWERHPAKAAYPIEIDHLAKSRARGSV